jgi:acetoin utilization protein AcuB
MNKPRSLSPDVALFPSAQALRALRAGDVMTSNPVTLAPETPLSDALTLIDTRGIRHFPVVAAGRLAGLLSERHLRDAMPSILTVEDPEARRRFLRVTLVSQVAAKDPATERPDAQLTDVIDTMRRHRVGALPIVEASQVVGIITSGDLIALLDRVLRSADRW